MIKLSEVKYVGKKTYEKLVNNNINDIEDLINLRPVYQTYQLVEFNKQADLISIKGVISSNINNFKKNVRYTTFKFLTNNQTLNVIAYNQSYLSNQLKTGDEIIITGKYDIKTKRFNLSKWDKLNKFKSIETSYGLDGIYDYAITKIIKEILTNHHLSLKDLNKHYLTKFMLKDKMEVYSKLHFPQSIDDIDQVTNYFKHDEAFKYYYELNNSDIVKKDKKVRSVDLKIVKNAIKELSFELTDDQKTSVNDIFSDFKTDVSQSRLLLGDVGSGKTVVAGIAAVGMKTAGYVTALMAPTVILARQHYENLKATFKDLNVGLFTSEQARKEMINDLAKRDYDLIIGTHVLASSDVIIKNLGFVIIDEQHKFGVNERANLINKAFDYDLLYLTATPIPRTLFITLFGNKEMSVIRSMPKDRLPIITKKFDRHMLKTVFKDIKNEIGKGNNTYIVVPSIKETANLYGIQTILNVTRKYLENENILVLSGEMKKDEQQRVVDEFNSAKGAVLISTTIVEVGIDVKHATRMIIFQSNRFGLSQLHQLRGRIGRSNLASVCYVQQMEQSDERLDFFVNNSSGFTLSEYDLKTRGPGYYLKTIQSGVPKFKWIDYEADFEILINVRNQIYQTNI